MFSAINTKLMLVMVALLASIASIVAFEQHKKSVEEAKAKAAQEALWKKVDQLRAKHPDMADSLKSAGVLSKKDVK
jgi:uncharacterized protein YpmB